MAFHLPPLTSKAPRVLLIIFTIIFTEFLIMGVCLGILPGFVHNTLQFSNFVVGVIIGLQYLSTLLTRHLAGQSADIKGGKPTVLTGLILSVLSGCCCVIGSIITGFPIASLILLGTSRVLLGIGESYLVIGVFAWGFVLVGPSNTGKVMVWNGLGMYGGMACGAPLGIYLQTQFGLKAAFVAIILMPVISYTATWLLPKLPLIQVEKRLPFYKAVKIVWRSGAGLALASIGFGGIASFITLYFARQGWADASMALTAFGCGYVVTRLFFAHFPDKFGGASVAIVSLFVEVIGQLLIWQARNGEMAIIGALLTGAGMSLVFPSFGQMAIKGVSPANRGMAMAAYNAFFDLGMGLTAPVAGLVSKGEHYDRIYLLGSVAAVIGLSLALQAYRKGRGAASRFIIAEQAKEQS
ncbi:arabinose transporter [Mucilaginibacter robiniae]|uniref:Arabinose transporter n=1 Tax=Mucilaginibacter robiniae TaxID=2728022 RepID=A0A7L5E1T8_9SPHI|nr:MFS transporter [Mucilaginibacter robiniae]QJD97322.1 arabinose transporter [Mucilaginibacter robiniae]